MHDHTHAHACGHDHGPDLHHEIFPPPQRIAVLVVVTADSAAAASAPLRAPWGVAGPSPEPALSRSFRLLKPYPWLRRVVVLPKTQNDLQQRADILANTVAVVASGAGFGESLSSGLKVTLSVTRPPEAILIWDLVTPLAHPATLYELLASGAPLLCKPEHRWARFLARDPRQPFLGGPFLCSLALAQELSASHTPFTELLRDNDTLLQRVITDDPYALLKLDSSIRIRDFSARDDGLTV